MKTSALKTLDPTAHPARAVGCRPWKALVVKHRILFGLSGLLLALTVNGCVTTSTPPDGAASHPASVQAAPSPEPPFRHGLLDMTNVMAEKPVTGAAREHPHGHGKHEMKPKPEEKP